MDKSTQQRLHSFRLSPQADALLRKNAPRRGAIKQRILSALQGVDMEKVNPSAYQRKAGPTHSASAPQYMSTTITMPENHYQALKRLAQEKGTSVTVLVDTCILMYYSNSANSFPA